MREENMKPVSILSVTFAALVGTSMGFAVHAATSNNPDMDKNAPSSVSESAPDKAGKKDKGKAGEATMPKKGPSSVSESAPDKTGKDKAAPKMKDSKDMSNPKAPSSPNESKPSQK
jgi:hypothetical protein